LAFSHSISERRTVAIAAVMRRGDGNRIVRNNIALGESHAAHGRQKRQP
jgi:hypothetical protein